MKSRIPDPSMKIPIERIIAEAECIFKQISVEQPKGIKDGKYKSFLRQQWSRQEKYSRYFNDIKNSRSLNENSN